MAGRRQSRKPFMSRLESFIRRLTAQRDILDMICRDMEMPTGR